MRRREQESGFAMLLVFLMAAVIAIMLYMEIPRIAFESQRQKEQLLIERGQQYKRAIQVFVLNNKRWPSKIEDLENFNNRRYLRRRYIDPMTGKDEWRIIHVAANGQLTDSMVNKPKQTADSAGATPDNYISELPGLQGSNTPGAGVPNALTRRRASDNVTLSPIGSDIVPTQTSADSGATPLTGLGPNPASGGSLPPGVPGIPGQPGQPYAGPPGIRPITSTGAMGMPVAIGGQVGSNAGNNSGGSPYIGSGCYIGNCGAATPGMPGAPNTAVSQPGYPGMPGAPVNSQTGGVSASPYSTDPGMPGTPVNSQGQNQAAQMIQGLLTSPRPTGMPTSTTTGQQNTMGGGWAGVASTVDADGIMVYNDHTNYGEWEFIFDLNKYRPPANPITGMPAMPVGAAQQSLQQPSSRTPSQ